MSISIITSSTPNPPFWEETSFWLISYSLSSPHRNTPVIDIFYGKVFSSIPFLSSWTGQASVVGTLSWGKCYCPWSYNDPPSLSKWGCREKQKEERKVSVKCFELCYHPAHPILFFFLVRIYRHSSHFVQLLYGDWLNISWIQASFLDAGILREKQSHHSVKQDSHVCRSSWSGVWDSNRITANGRHTLLIVLVLEDTELSKYWWVYWLGTKQMQMQWS